MNKKVIINKKHIDSSYVTIPKNEYNELIETLSRLEQDNSYLRDKLNKLNRNIKFLMESLPPQVLGDAIKLLWKR